MNSYCTLFDSFYLTRGLSLYRSLVATGDEFQLFIFCFDDLSYDLLTHLNLKYIRLVSLKEFETPELLRVKGSRNQGEYCWTCTSSIIDHCLTHYGLPEVTYLDADLYFFERPSVLLDEFHQTGTSVLITEHRYAPEHDRSAVSGIYCVQFMTFKNDERGRKILGWWKARCIEWCYNRVEDGKFGDQKYLDDWTTRFSGVHVLAHLGGGVAPWNIQKYTVDKGPAVNHVPIVFYHFHGFRWLTSKKFDLCLGNYQLSSEAIHFIYEPYLAEIKQALQQVRRVQADFDLGKVRPDKFVKGLLKNAKELWGGYYQVVRE